MSAVNPDLVAERSTASFRPDDVTVHLYGDGMQRRRIAHQRASNDPAFAIAEKFSMMPDRDQIYDQAVNLACQMTLKAAEYGYTDKDDSRSHFKSTAFIDTVYPFGLHDSMFKTTVESQATEEQRARWGPKIKSMEMIGTYAQTEMGHGTFLRGLETTATFDRNTDEFILHSPTTTSIKYWPGGLGKTSNCAIVMAQLIVDGKKYGVHLFMVHLRDTDTHQPLPGVEVGDINRKFGYDNLDNGFLKLTSKRIPRTDMLMKFTKVDRNGKYSREALPQLTYLTMVILRWMIVLGSAADLSMAATITTRYSAVRHQTANSKGVEPQVLHYQTQQMKVMPAISASYALFFSGLKIREIYYDIYESVSAGDTSRLPEIHNLTSGMKAYATDMATELIEVCRRACGGHGYSHASGLPKIYQRCVPGCTYEGENTVMYLQCARGLLKFYGKAQAEEKLPATLQFLLLTPVVPRELHNAEKLNIDQLVTAYKYNALMSIMHTAGRMQSDIYNDNADPEVAWNNNSQALVDMAKAQARYLTAQMFADRVLTTGWEPKAQSVMKKVLEFFMVNNIVEHSGSFMQNEVLSRSQIHWLQQRRVELLQSLRPEAVTLVDAFDYPDRMLNSCLGRYDGQVYEALYEFAKQSSLNRTQVHSSFEKYIKPMRNHLKAKL